MKFSFQAKIHKVGINPCVEVPARVTSGMVPARGYIPITGLIMTYAFEQTLVPVKGSRYRLYVNGLMLKGSGTKVGDTARFVVEQTAVKRKDATMSADFSRKLRAANLLTAFKELLPSRQKEILRYINYLRTEEAKTRNIQKVLASLEKLR